MANQYFNQLNKPTKQFEQITDLFPYLRKEKREHSFENIGWDNGGIGSIINFEILNGWITDMTLRIELPEIIADQGTTGYNVNIHTGNIPTTGYLNWVDSIGHAIIDKLEFQLGKHKIIPQSLPYGTFLDIYNELNDKNRQEWDLIGKYRMLHSIKRFETNKRILYVPLHLWFSEDISKALPSFLFNTKPSTKKQFSITLFINHFKHLMVSNITNNVPITIPNPKIDLLYDVLVIPEDNPMELKTYIEELKEVYKLNPYRIFFDNYSFYNEILKENLNVVNFTTNNPIKELLFVISLEKRQTKVDARTTTTSLNELSGDTYGNDYFNYTNDKTFSKLGNTNDSFTNLSISLRGNHAYDFMKNNDALYLRKVIPLKLYNKVPNKHIYVIDFNNNKNNNNKKDYIINGYLECTSDTKIDFIFDTIEEAEKSDENKKLKVFAKEINFLEIKVAEDDQISINYNSWNSIPTIAISNPTPNPQ